MTRDNSDRLNMFTSYYDLDTHVDVRRLALNMDQIEELKPPPNPAKSTDARAKPYIARYGVNSWELDALKPAFINDLITDEIEGIVDHELWDETMEQETSDRKKLKRFIDDNNL